MILSHSARAGRTLWVVAVEGQLPGRVLSHRRHEGVGDEDREVEHAQPPGFALGLDEGLDVGMVAAHRRHHRAAAIAGAHDGAAHRVPHIHEGQRPRGVRADALHRRALGPQGREVVADAAALLHRQRRLAQMAEDAGHVVRDRPHDEAVEEGDVAAGAGAGDDPARRQELEIGERRGKARRPMRPDRARARPAPSRPARQVSSMVLSTAAPSGPLSRYFMSQICCEIEATLAMRNPRRIRGPRQTSGAAANPPGNSLIRPIILCIFGRRVKGLFQRLFSQRLVNDPMRASPWQTVALSSYPRFRTFPQLCPPGSAECAVVPTSLS